MLNLDLNTLAQVVNSAKLSAANDPRWINPIERAAAELETNPYLEALDNHTLLIGSTSGKTYTANGSCQCEAHAHAQPCYHRAMSRLYQRYTKATARKAAHAKALAEINELF